MSQEPQEAQDQPAKDQAQTTPAKRGYGDAKPKRAKRSKNAPAEGGAPAQQLTTTATEARRAELVELEALPIFSEAERMALRFVNIERRDPRDAVRLMNEAQNTQAWNMDELGRVLRQVDAKLLRAGEINAARPNAHVVEETRRRYDHLIELAQSDLAMVPQSAGFLSLRAKLIKTIADIQRIRDEALQALAPLPGTLPSNAALVYVSRLRSEPPSA